MQTGNMLIRIEDVLLKEKPDMVMVYGDTNSTLAGSLATCKLNIPLVHVEAGLRSFNREMPEEYNRIISDHCADILFCPTKTAVANLKKEGVTEGVHLAGDTMYDAVLHYVQTAAEKSTIIETLDLRPGKYLLATVHRAYNTDTPEKLLNIIAAFREIDMPIVFPVHPRTKAKLSQRGEASDQLKKAKKLKITEPLGYLDMLMLEKHARLILTDSGGMQKEAFFLGVPCVTLRPETEWVETVEAGWNVIVGTDKKKIIEAVHRTSWPKHHPKLFGDGNAAAKIAAILLQQ
jgi:UDP-N-acetylglucosamine 2-epimerase